MSLLDDIAAATEAYGLAVEAGTMVEPDGVPTVIVAAPMGDLGYGDIRLPAMGKLVNISNFTTVVAASLLRMP